MSIVNDFLKNAFTNAVNLGQDKVSDAQFKERVAVCMGCPHMGKVRPLPTLEFNEGCTLCHCPLATKARLINHTILGSASCELGKWQQIDDRYHENS
jgi:hypothetical protein